MEGAANATNVVDEVEKSDSKRHDRSYPVEAFNERPDSFGALCALHEGKGLSSRYKGARGQDAGGEKFRANRSSSEEGGKEKEEGRERAQGVAGAGDRRTENEEDEQEAAAQYQANKAEQGWSRRVRACILIGDSLHKTFTDQRAMKEFAAFYLMRMPPIQRNNIMIQHSSRCFSSSSELSSESLSTPSSLSSSSSSTAALLEKPVEPSPSECCGNGCKDCVWESYYDKLCLYEEQQEKLSNSSKKE